MKPRRFRKKSIAAPPAPPMLAVPFSGCSRTATTSGASGKGILGDFLAGGIYGGLFVGLLRPGGELPEGAFVFSIKERSDSL